MLDVCPEQLNAYKSCRRTSSNSYPLSPLKMRAIRAGAAVLHIRRLLLLCIPPHRKFSRKSRTGSNITRTILEPERSTMAWRYPQPRALTKVRVFPVPYKMSLGYQEDLVVVCHLEYWSECRNCYLPYTQFYLSESEVCHLTLPQGTPRTVVASTWRVVITTVNEGNSDEDLSKDVVISPRALAACMRIDSYFDKSLIPHLTAALYVTKIELALYNYFDKRGSACSQDARLSEELYTRFAVSRYSKVHVDRFGESNIVWSVLGNRRVDR
ncbi:unnamed protein product [Acanthoscelides obtectus]|uniref:Uncharacterized protein n=1 Tax=Acanthoscelides obtectus TaxID=200917 RepID=A0A9P0QG32_ACAOB|nr:unnamed protein product [Acanthoscelides obtectus]CAK1689217.1 Vacuolar protein sorting-associated protein 13B [Acanthoscelides obtectus]